MPKAILTLRSYPLAILMALVLFVCSFLIATSSIGTIGGGGGGEDDQGSGMGGTGRAGGYNGDSGLGGTGDPSPFLGSSDAVEKNGNIESDSNSSDSLIAPFLQQQETARIPDEMRPLIELQRNPPQSPDLRNSTPALDILDEDRAQLPIHLRRVLEMAESGDTTIVEPTLEIQVQIPEATGTDSIERYRLELAGQTELATTEPDADTRANGDSKNNAEAPFVMEQLNADEIAGNDTNKAVDEELLELEPDASDSSRPLIPERIQRPELPPFQRMRPAVDRASITPPRPRPMAI